MTNKPSFLRSCSNACRRLTMGFYAILSSKIDSGVLKTYICAILSCSQTISKKRVFWSQKWNLANLRLEKSSRKKFSLQPCEYYILKPWPITRINKHFETHSFKYDRAVKAWSFALSHDCNIAESVWCATVAGNYALKPEIFFRPQQKISLASSATKILTK